ncbi:MAG: hypothetical protein LUF25_00080 [Phascolarctobacterium sp.]|nr:hypothetical protein [Phascolarctobacterium sp.]
MNVIPLFFITIKMFALMNTRQVAFSIQNIVTMLQSMGKSSGKKQFVLVNQSAMIFIFYMIADILFLFYCLWLMCSDDTWTPGCMLLIISAMESYAMHVRIDGTYTADPLGFVYPRLWFKYLMNGQSLFILLKLLHS